MTARPDFVVVGWQADGKVWLMASRTLSHMELETECERIRSWPGRDVWARDRITLRGELSDYVIVVGDDYGQAWRTLFDEWSPEPARAELDARPAIQRARNIAYHELGIEPPPAGPRAIEP